MASDIKCLPKYINACVNCKLHNERVNYYIGVGAGPAGPVLAGPTDVIIFIIDICARAVTDRVPYARAYYSRSYAPVLVSLKYVVQKF